MIKEALQEVAEVATALSHQRFVSEIELIGDMLVECFKAGNKVMICGNGGSACDAAHFAEEFTGKFRKTRRPLPVMALNDPAHITCVANDWSFGHVFSRNVKAFGKAADVIILLSTSGDSENVIQALIAAQDMHLHTVALLGKDGGFLNNQCEHAIVVPNLKSERIQEAHMTILHILVEYVERKMFPENYED
jgi:D-sedoheptulose 7-phosphate isomerase